MNLWGMTFAERHRRAGGVLELHSITSSGAVAQAPTNHLFLVGFNRSSRPFLFSSCARADLSNGRMRTPGQGLLAIGSPPSIQQRVHVKTGAFASNVLQSCVSCRLILKSFSPPPAATDEVVHPKLAHVAERHRRVRLLYSFAAFAP
jgi:hypothetical protein